MTPLDEVILRSPQATEGSYRDSSLSFRMTNNQRNKMRIAIIDFTDCEGCELEFLASDETIGILEDFELVHFRLLQENSADVPHDIAFVEGVITNQDDAERLKKIRESTKILVALGACAVTGGIPAYLQSNRNQAARKIYGPGYKLKAEFTRPLKDFVHIDYDIDGCPVDPAAVRQFLEAARDNKINPQKQTQKFVARREFQVPSQIDSENRK